MLRALLGLLNQNLRDVSASEVIKPPPSCVSLERGSGGVGTRIDPKAVLNRRREQAERSLGGGKAAARAQIAWQRKSRDALGEAERDPPTQETGEGRLSRNWQRDKAGGKRRGGSAADPERQAAADARAPTRKRVQIGPAWHTPVRAPRDNDADSRGGLLPKLVSVGPRPVDESVWVSPSRWRGPWGGLNQ